MSLETLVEKYYSDFRKNQIGSIKDKDELEKLLGKLNTFKEEVNNFSKDELALDELVVKENNINNFLDYLSVPKVQVLKEISNSIDFINNKINFLNKHGDISLDTLKGEFLNILKEGNVGILNNFLTVNGKSLFQHILQNEENHEFIKTLFDFVFNFNSTIEENTDLFIAQLANKNFDLVQILLNYEIDVNRKGPGGFTPLMAALVLLNHATSANEIKNYMRIIYLLCQGEDVKIDSVLNKDHNNITALDYAMTVGTKGIPQDVFIGFVNFLKSKGANSYTNSEGEITIDDNNKEKEFQKLLKRICFKPEDANKQDNSETSWGNWALNGIKSFFSL